MQRSGGKCRKCRECAVKCYDVKRSAVKYCDVQSSKEREEKSQQCIDRLNVCEQGQNDIVEIYQWNKTEESSVSYQLMYCPMRCRGETRIDYKCIPCYCQSYMYIRSCLHDYVGNQTVVELCERDIPVEEETVETFVQGHLQKHVLRSVSSRDQFHFISH
ncbi:hypothetical protein Bpfe_026363 [Biomphalaria pfeifferi]|uniref:Uncharacterized protein n=1 Tax=Biomphalaria pfeifferi TaxID=112525 RepID=A0AAD8AYV6_BIOPF|nr:hypothetical protein Bpfe_026363 [Biomphalaria pfeifferi]